MTYETKLKIIIQQLREDRDRLLDVIDKIRAEIANDIHNCNNNNDMAFGMQHTLDIIDKYYKENKE